jgi:UDP-glucose 4-epimerase
MSNKTWLITGGAGYIGSHIANEFLREGKNIVIYDSLFRGSESRVNYLRQKYGREIPLIVADIRDAKEFALALQTHKPDGVIHTAALKAVGESIDMPDEYFEVNHQATKEILKAMSRLNIKRFVFSSTAAVYGSPDTRSPIQEDGPTKPISPYGASKLAAEYEVNEFLNQKDCLGTSLRFFNVVGSDTPELSDTSRDNLVPIVLDKIKNKQPPIIFGVDYPTFDGTCVRDYVDVRDIAKAHLVVANCDQELPRALNVGRGFGTSVREVITLMLRTLDCEGTAIMEDIPRAGDCAYLVADCGQIRNLLGVNCDITLEESISSLL